MLVGNKCDLLGQRKVEFASAEKFAADHGISLFEVSAKSGMSASEYSIDILNWPTHHFVQGINVEDAFVEITSSMRERLLLSKMGVGHYYDSTDEEEISSGFHIDGVMGKPKIQESSCCFSGNNTRINGTSL